CGRPSGRVGLWRRPDVADGPALPDRAIRPARLVVWRRGPRLVPSSLGRGPRGEVRPPGDRGSPLAAGDQAPAVREEELPSPPRLVLPAVEASRPEAPPAPGRRQPLTASPDSQSRLTGVQESRPRPRRSIY